MAGHVGKSMNDNSDICGRIDPSRELAEPGRLNIVILGEIEQKS